MFERVWLDVPFAQKDTAKAAGARWDADRVRWYAPRRGMIALSRWLPRGSGLSDPLPGEDRAFGDDLYVDLVPVTCWFTNVRSSVTRTSWERLRTLVLSRTGRVCEGCGTIEHAASGRWLEVHERFDYDDRGGVQRLCRLIALCARCHAVTHFGLTRARGLEEEALEHLMGVTGFSYRQALEHVEDAEDECRERSEDVWELDLSILTDAGLSVREAPAARYRPGAAADRLDRSRD